MNGMDANSAGPRAGKWRTRFSLIFGAAVVLGACLAVRSLWGPGSASATAPTAPATRNAKASATPVKASISDQPAQASGPEELTVAPLSARLREMNVMAVVNGEPISRQELAQECLRRYGEDVLESFVNKHLILQACQERGLVITEKAVDQEVERLAGKFGLSADRYLNMLQRERDIAPQQYRRDIIWPTLALRHLVADKTQVTREELDKAIESEYGAKVKARLISVSSREKAEQLRAQAVADPEQFGTLAKDHSEDPHSASALGIIPPIRKHIGDPKIERVAFSMKEGDISPIVQVGDQYIILKCERHLPEAFITTEMRQQAEARLRDQILEHKMREAAPELFQKLQSDAKIVNVMNDPELSRKMPGVAATINGQSITIQQLSEECLVRHGAEVLDGEVNRRLLQQELQRRGLSVSEKDIDEEIARAADAYGFLKADGTPDVERWLKKVTEEDGATVELYVRDAVWPSVALKRLVGDKVEVTEEDLTKGFEANYGERVEVMAIVVSNQRIAQQVWEMARNNPNDQFFGELANQYSIEPVSRANFGKVPPIQKHGGQPALEEEAFRLKAGELSGIITIGDRHIILKCLGRTKPVVQELEVVKDELEKYIRENKLRVAMVKEFDRLKETAQIDNYLAGTSQLGKQPASKLPGAPVATPSAARPVAPPSRR